MNTKRTHLLRASAMLGTALLLSATGSAQDAVAAVPPAAPAASDAMTINYLLIGLAVVQVIMIIALSGTMRLLGSSSRGGDITKALVLLVSLAAAAPAHAAGPNAGIINNEELTWWLATTNIFLFVVLLVQLNLTRFMTKSILGAMSETERSVARKAESWEMRIWRKMTNRVPTEREADVMLDHNYDGIRELDNVLPPWWLWLFYGTIVYAVVYLINVHVIGVWPHQADEYTQEMAQAKADVAAYQAQFKGMVDENNVTVLTDAPSVAGGASIFAANCTPCHGTQLEGKEGLGPNLTDIYWKHGGGIKNVFHTITYGVPEKGMISWKAQLKPLEIQQLASFILSKAGSNPPNAKAPEGDPWAEGGAATDSTSAPKDSVKVIADTTRLAQTKP